VSFVSLCLPLGTKEENVMPKLECVIFKVSFLYLINNNNRCKLNARLSN
jgi:hypothetical protein